MTIFLWVPDCLNLLGACSMELDPPAKKRRTGEGKLAGKFALVTAAAQGIGEATARVSLSFTHLECRLD